MIVIEATRRRSSTAVARIRDIFLHYDRVVFKAVDPDPEYVYRIVRQGPKNYVLVVDDPSLR